MGFGVRTTVLLVGLAARFGMVGKRLVKVVAPVVHKSARHIYEHRLLGMAGHDEVESVVGTLRVVNSHRRKPRGLFVAAYISERQEFVHSLALLIGRETRRIIGLLPTPPGPAPVDNVAPEQIVDAAYHSAVAHGAVSAQHQLAGR